MLMGRSFGHLGYIKEVTYNIPLTRVNIPVIQIPNSTYSTTYILRILRDNS